MAHIQTFPYESVPAEQAPMGEGVSLRWVISRQNGAPRFAMRVFEVKPGGFIPEHHHWYEQEMYVLEGEGTIAGPDGERAISAGTVIYVPPDEPHAMRNTGSTPLRFICCIPNRQEPEAEGAGAQAG